MLKHSSRVNLEDLDFEEVDKEMEVDEAAQVAIAALEENALEEMIVNLRRLVCFWASNINFETIFLPNVFLGFKY